MCTRPRWEFEQENGEREKRRKKKNATTGLLLRHRHLSHSFRKVSHFNGRVNMFAYQANELSATAKPMFCHFDVRLHAHGTRHTEPLLLARVLASVGGALNCTWHWHATCKEGGRRAGGKCGKWAIGTVRWSVLIATILPQDTMISVERMCLWELSIYVFELLSATSHAALRRRTDWQGKRGRCERLAEGTTISFSVLTQRVI